MGVYFFGFFSIFLYNFIEAEEVSEEDATIKEDLKNLRNIRISLQLCMLASNFFKDSFTYPFGENIFSDIIHNPVRMPELHYLLVCLC